MQKSNTGKTPFNNSRVKRSVKLTKEEMKELKAFVKEHTTNTDAAEAIGISRETLFHVMLKGSGSSITINLIRQSLNIEA